MEDKLNLIRNPNFNINGILEEILVEDQWNSRNSSGR